MPVSAKGVTAIGSAETRRLSPPPLSREPESFDRPADACRLTPSVGRTNAVQAAFQSVDRPARSGVPERFRGGCSFGAPDQVRGLSRARPWRFPPIDPPDV